MRMNRLLALLVVGALLWGAPFGKKKKKDKKEEQTQVLELPPEPPNAVLADTARLAFQVSPLSPKGLLSQQTREALKGLMRRHRRATIVKLRAFVAGTGDMRRVAMIVGEIFSDKKQPLPALSVIQAGALPMEGAQVVLESTAVERKPVNPHGLAFISGQAAPSVRDSINRLQAALAAAALQPADMLRVTCFVNILDEGRAGFAAARTAFPQAALNLVQMQREPALPPAECEGVARLQAPQREPVRFLNPPSDSPDASQTVLVSAPKIVISGTQLAFHDQASDIRLAFERLGKALDPLGADLKGVVMTHLYSLSRSTAERVKAVRLEYYDKTHPPATTMLLFEGLPSLDASFAVDVIALPKK
jgi:enamine deaminase RidA (YjgF/YER057c/UK114 family)